jgi:hypothetical protein
MHATAGGFSDFEVLVAAQRAGGVYPVTVIESPAGQAEGEFRPPMPAQELEVLLAGLAYAMKLNQTPEVPIDQALETIGREMSEIRLPQLSPQQVLDGLFAVAGWRPPVKIDKPAES